MDFHTNPNAFDITTLSGLKLYRLAPGYKLWDVGGLDSISLTIQFGLKLYFSPLSRDQRLA